MATKAVSKPDQFAIVTVDGARSNMIDTLKQLGVSNFQLKRVKVPAGGATVWSVPTLTGEEHLEHLDVILLLLKGGERSWWRDSMEGSDGHSPPDCVSHDGVKGFGVTDLGGEDDPAEHDCLSCNWAQWGSDRKGGKGKDCKETILAFFFRKNSRVPSLLVVPPTSIKAFQSYMLDLADEGAHPQGVITRLSLEKVAGAQPYAVIRPTCLSVLPDEKVAAMVELRRQFESMALDVAVE